MKLTVISLLCLFVAACASTSSNPRQPASFSRPPFPLSEQCQDFIRELSPSYKYGWVTTSRTPLAAVENVEENPVHVFYYHRPAAGKTPILVFNGGPSSDSHFIYRKLENDEEMTAENAWLVFLDQRGTGCSSPYPYAKDPKEYLYWGTEGIVRDSEAVRAALKIPKWSIFGQSYGSFIVHRYLQMNPEAIDMAVGHGGAPLGGYSDYNRLRYEQQLFVIKKYLQKYPSDIELVKTIVRKRRCLEGGYICGGYAVRLLSSSAMGFNESWFFLHDSLKLLANSKIPQANLEETSEEDEEDRLNSINYWLNAELNGSYSAVNCNKVRRQALQILGPAELFALSECWGKNGSEGTGGLSEEEYRTTMDNLKIPTLSTKAIRENLEKYPDIKFYLFSSELDFYTPPAVMSRAASELGPRVKYEKILYAGHEAYLYSPVLRVFLPGLDRYLKAKNQ